MGEPSSSSHASASTVCVVFYDEEGDPDSDFLEEHLLPGYMVITKSQNWIVRATRLAVNDYPFEELHYGCPFCEKEHRHYLFLDVHSIPCEERGGYLLPGCSGGVFGCVCRRVDGTSFERCSHRHGECCEMHGFSQTFEGLFHRGGVKERKYPGGWGKDIFRFQYFIPQEMMETQRNLIREANRKRETIRKKRASLQGDR